MTSVQAQALAAARQHELQRRRIGASDAALTGASLAFHSPQSKPKPALKPPQLTSSNTKTIPASESPGKSNDANGPRLSRTPTGSVPPSTHKTGDGSVAGRSIDQEQSAFTGSAQSRNASPARQSGSLHAPSNIAASLAATRLSPRPQIEPHYAMHTAQGAGNAQKQDLTIIHKIRARQASIHRRAGEASVDGTGDNDREQMKMTDTTSMSSTNTLVNRFEKEPADHTHAKQPTTPSGEKMLPNNFGGRPQNSAGARKLRARQSSIRRRRGSGSQNINLTNGGESASTDASPIAPTRSLVRAFEQGAESNLHNKHRNPRSEVQADLARVADAPKPKLPSHSSSTSALNTDYADTDRKKQRHGQSPSLSSPAAVEASEPCVSSRSATYASVPETTTKPIPPPPRRGGVPKPHNARSTSPPQASTPTSIPDSHHTPLSPAHNSQDPRKTSISPARPSPLGGRPVYLHPTNHSQTSVKRISPHISGSNYADAIVAASLSSRTPSPNSHRRHPSPPLLPARMEPRHHHLPFPHRRTRTVSPPKKGLRATMREDTSSDSSNDVAPHRRRRHRIVRKHPHKHHEGDRLRWRSTIKASERKRYEGVFASNKGRLLSSNPEASAEVLRASDEVHGLVVRDIWSRSHLPPDCLREIWDLVAGQGGAMRLDRPPDRASLCREEFVVGMWLIDQRLRGRKLPIKVSGSVWGSVRGVGGVVVSKVKRK
ncbi:MAG: Increased rDNA silencing protein [Bathelium mastoideum]|nr:MAG: Increased rDNA silencing protein [Bathelium mastoideum]